MCIVDLRCQGWYDFTVKEIKESEVLSWMFRLYFPFLIYQYRNNIPILASYLQLIVDSNFIESYWMGEDTKVHFRLSPYIFGQIIVDHHFEILKGYSQLKYQLVGDVIPIFKHVVSVKTYLPYRWLVNSTDVGMHRFNHHTYDFVIMITTLCYTGNSQVYRLLVSFYYERLPTIYGDWIYFNLEEDYLYTWQCGDDIFAFHYGELINNKIRIPRFGIDSGFFTIGFSEMNFCFNTGYGETEGQKEKTLFHRVDNKNIGFCFYKVSREFVGVKKEKIEPYKRWIDVMTREEGYFFSIY